MSLALERLSVRYGAHVALRELTLTIAPGAVVALIGASGSGKSSAALAAIGLLPEGGTASGGVTIDGRPFVAADRGRRLAMIFQDPATALNPALTIGRQIGEAAGLSRDAVEAALAQVGLDVPPSRYPHQLSGGQRQRVAIAAALAGAPACLIADEPTAALDPASRTAIADLLAEVVRERGLGLLLITHDLALAARLADRVAVLDDGALIEEGTRDILAAPRSPALRALAAAALLHPAPPAPRVGGPLLVLDHVARTYRSGWRGPAVRALDDISLTVSEGETVALVGPSGAGKSTLARIALGLERPDRGRVTLAGLAPDSDSRAVRRLAQAVPQDPATSFDPRHSIARAIAEPLRLLDPPIDVPARVAASLAEVGLDPAIGPRSPATLSGGQRQRVALARALIVGPRLIVLDEPLSALDLVTRAAMIDLLLRLQAERGIACLLIAHDLELVQALAHRVVALRDGRIDDAGTAAYAFAQAKP